MQGTTFVLQKKLEPRQRLLEAISLGSGVIEAVDELVSTRNKEDKGYDENLIGEWQLVWASESEGGNWEAIVARGLKGKQIVKKNGQIENLVDRFPAFRYRANGNLVKTSESNAYQLSMDNGYTLVSGFKFPLDIKSRYTMELLYIDNKIRITRDNKDIMFVHLRIG